MLAEASNNSGKTTRAADDSDGSLLAMEAEKIYLARSESQKTRACVPNPGLSHNGCE